MIAWAIQTAVESKLFDRVIVSTDDFEISELAKILGADVPFMRPMELSGDLIPTIPVVQHAIEFMNKLGIIIKSVCCIYPCVPFLLPKDLLDGYDLMQISGSNFVYPICEYPHPIQRALSLSDDELIKLVHPQFEMTRTQDLEPLYHDVGQFYWGMASSWLEKKRMHSEAVGLRVPSWRFVDIDTEEDWLRAELIFRASQL